MRVPTLFSVPLLLVFLMAPAFGRDSRSDDAYTACERLVLDYAWYRDHPDADRYAALFTEDAELSILGETYRGRPSIRQRLQSASGRTVHLMSGIRIDQDSATSARGTSYVTVYTTPAGDGPHDVKGFAAIGEYHDEFRKTAEGWQIARRTLVVRLRDASVPPPSAAR